MKSLTLLVHGESGHGKSWFSITCPGPRLYLDCEGRAVHLKTPKVYWDPRSQPLPAAMEDGSPITTDTTVVVDVRDYPTFELCYQWLASGQHYFESVIVDSLTELQQRCLDGIAGVNTVTTPQWGDLLRKMDKTVRDIRDLRTHPTKKVRTLVIVAGCQEKDGRTRPLLQGALSNRLAYHFDLVGFINFQLNPETGIAERVMAIQPYGLFVAKDNTDSLSRHYGLYITNPNITEMLAVLDDYA